MNNFLIREKKRNSRVIKYIDIDKDFNLTLSGTSGAQVSFICNGTTYHITFSSTRLKYPDGDYLGNIVYIQGSNLGYYYYIYKYTGSITTDYPGGLTLKKVSGTITNRTYYSNILSRGVKDISSHIEHVIDSNVDTRINVSNQTYTLTKSLVGAYSVSLSFTITLNVKYLEDY